MPPAKSRAAGDAAALGRGRHRLTLAHRSAEFGPEFLMPQSRQRRPGQAVERLAAAPAEIPPQSIGLASNYRLFRRAVRAAPIRSSSRPTTASRSHGEVDSDRRSGRVRLRTPTLETAMQVKADRPETPSAIRSDFGAIFISLELSRSIWLITSLSPGGGEKMSKHSVPAGDIAALLARFSELKQKALARTGKSFPIVVIQEAGLDGFWIH